MKSTERKRKVRRALRRGEGDGQAYRGERLAYRKMLERKKRESNDRWEREVQNKNGESGVGSRV